MLDDPCVPEDEDDPPAVDAEGPARCLGTYGWSGCKCCADCVHGCRWGHHRCDDRCATKTTLCSSCQMEQDTKRIQEHVKRMQEEVARLAASVEETRRAEAEEEVKVIQDDLARIRVSVDESNRAVQALTRGTSFGTTPFGTT